MSASGWHRLSPFAIVYFTARQFAQILDNAVPLAAAGIIAIFSLDFASLLLYLTLSLVVMGLFATLHYLNFLYVQQEDRFVIREGVVSRNRLEVPFAKIQNLTVKQPFYYRPFDLVVLSMDSAGSSAKEVEIVALKRADADLINARVLAVREERQPTGRAEEAAGLSEGEEVSHDLLLIKRSPWDIVLHGITNNRAWLIFIVILPLLGQLEPILLRTMQSLGVDLQQWVASQTIALLFMATVALIIMVVVVMSLFSVLGSIVMLFGYQLSYRCQSYVRQSGLLNKYEIQIRRNRIQSVVLSQTALDRVFERYNVLLEPFSGGQNAQQKQSFMQKIMVPSLLKSEARELLAHLYPGLDLNRINFRRISAHYMVRALLLFVSPIALTSALIFHQQLPSISVSAAWLVLLLGSFLAWLRWRSFGVAIDRGMVILRAGLLGRRVMAVPVNKVQQVKFVQSIFLRRRNLAHVHLVTASRTFIVPFVPSLFAKRLADWALYRVEFSNESWM